MRQVVPLPAGAVTIDDAYDAPLGSHPDRPWIELCMVSSIDGSTVLDGVSGGLSSDNDLAVLARLRRMADVIVVGSGTVRGEGYGPPKKPGQRIGVISGRGSVDTSTELFESGAGFVITTTGATIDGGTAQVDVIRAGDDSVDLHRAVELVAELCPDTGVIQLEGGATLNAAFGEADLLDEMNLTTSPLTVGGAGPRIFNGAGALDQRFELAQMLVDDESFVFSRWLRRRAPSSP